MRRYLFLFLFLTVGCASTMSYQERMDCEKREEAILKEKSFQQWDVIGKIEKGLVNQCEQLN